ncbi:MAG: hypothetical protein JWN24_773 [Phycisphaerales bacterium]|nr:hypothetical protein [Phycisphaerales bacterium]
MNEKFDIYDVLGILVPGVLIVCAVPIAFPNAPTLLAPHKFPDAFSVVALTAASVFLGHLVQALASLCEPILNRTWGGRPSETALTSGLGDRYLPADSGARIRAKLAEAVGATATTRSLFLFAMQKAEGCKSRRVTVFNGLYAYHRVLVVLTALVLVFFLISFHRGLASHLTLLQSAGCIVLLLLLLALFWYRTKQRGFYYVREVLLCAEQALASPSGTSNVAEKGDHG